MSQLALPSDASTDTALVFEAVRAVSCDAGVIEALATKATTPSSVMDALLDGLRAYSPLIQATHMGVKTSRTAPKRKGEIRRCAVSCVQYLQTEDWFLGLDVDDSPVRDAARAEWGFVAFKGAAAVFEYETTRLGDPVVAWHHTLVDVSTVSPKCPIAAALVDNALQPLLAARARATLDGQTPLSASHPKQSPAHRF